MTDLPELIANVYRACGMEAEVSNAGVMSMWNDGRLVYVEGDETFPLAPFVRDIVPTLNERGWIVHMRQTSENHDQWIATVFGNRAGAPAIVSGNGPSPVEACFRAAWEALKDE